MHDCGTGELVTLTTTERMVEVGLGGGSGFGDPRERARSSVNDDVANGYVSAGAAARIYAAQADVSAAE
jgi:5-oxoprolinase (ATP-hydrolysing)/N-methylhydantoinase A